MTVSEYNEEQGSKLAMSQRRSITMNTTTTTTLCNHCDEGHQMQRRDHSQAVTKIITRQVDTNNNYKQTVSKSGVLRESRTVSGGGARRKWQSSVSGVCVTSEGREVEEQRQKKCIICRSNCKDINECQRVGTPIQDRCEQESGAAAMKSGGGDGGQRSSTEQQKQQQQQNQQRPECSVGGEEEEVEEVTRRRTGMAPDRCKKDVAGSEGGGSDTVQFALDWGGGEVECASDVKEKKKKRKSSPSSRGSVFFSGSTMFLLFIAFCMSTTTISPWNVGGLLMGPGAVLRAGASEIRVDRTSKTAQETGSKYKERFTVILSPWRGSGDGCIDWWMTIFNNCVVES